MAEFKPKFDDGTWLTPKQALAVAKAVVKENAESIITDQLSGSFFPAVADRFSAADGHGEPVIRPDPTPIPASYWPLLQNPREFWDYGNARFFLHPSITVRCSGVYFLKRHIDKAFPAPKDKPAPVIPPQIAPNSSRGVFSNPPPPVMKHLGGAPRKEFWDDLWLAMFERLWLTDWKPKNQTEIENAMLDWTAENGHKLGPTSVKIPAKKLLALSRK